MEVIEVEKTTNMKYIYAFSRRSID